MRFEFKSVVFLYLFAMLVSLSAFGQNPIRIMPLGDSITYGSGAAGGYRLPLYVALTNAGYNVDFVGTQTGNSDPGLGTEINHEGHGGWKITNPVNGLYDFIYDWFDQIEDPHVILLHIGTNDSSGFDSSLKDINNLDLLITRLAECQPDAQIIVTSLMKRNEPNYTYITNYFNPYVPGLVTNQQDLGRNVTFLDMHAYLELSDMPDNLHPDAGGYAKMAAAWLPAITNLVGTNPGPNRPAPMYAEPNINHVNVTINFNKTLNQASAENTANYSIGGGVTVTGASLSTNKRIVTLTTSAQTPGTTYTITMNNIEDETTPSSLSIPTDSQVTFTPSTPRGYENNVAESSEYNLVYSIDMPNTVNYRDQVPIYSVDNSARFDDGSFSRIAYYLELQKSGEDLQYIWVSMDAFTNKADKIGFPTIASGAIYQQLVQNMNVYCNVSGVTTGTGLSGNIEFWPYNYTAANAIGIPGASGSRYDFGDTLSYGGYHACMQIHNYAAGEVLMAINKWGSGDNYVALGIGTNPSGEPDWTFADNAPSYTVKTLQVLIKFDNSGDNTPPQALSAQIPAMGQAVIVTFDELLAPGSVALSDFSINNGVEVYSAELQSDGRKVLLTTSTLPETSMILTINGVRDAAGNLIAVDTMLPVMPLMPEEIITNVGTNAGQMAHGYELIYSVDLPIYSTFGDSIDDYYFDQSDIVKGFDRVAYYMELTPANGAPQYIWTSMDAFTDDQKMLGIPSFASGIVHQRSVSNLDVQSNVSSVTNGTSMAGNIEFWPTDYDRENGNGIPGASGTAYDFGDLRKTTGNYGSMQVHNTTYGQCLVNMSGFGSNGLTLSLGIGNRPGSSDIDWTLAANANNYVHRRMHILVRPTATPALPPEVAANITGAEDYYLAYSLDLPTRANFSATPDDYYSVNNYTNGLPDKFTRIAYYLELVSGVTTQFIWTAMDAFTSDASKIKVPTGNTVFQQYVSNLDVQSNVGGITTGSKITTGNIEFWPYNYSPGNSLGIPGASGTTFDYGDACSYSGNYGSMQVHNYGASQTLFALNRFNQTSSGADLCLGIGNNTSGPGYLDWTHNSNAASFNSRKLYIFILPGGDGDNTAPTLNKAIASKSLDQVAVLFSEEMADTASDPSKYSIDKGVTVSGATINQDKKSVTLTTSSLAVGQTYTLTVTGVRDRSTNGNLIQPFSSTGFTSPEVVLPEFFSDVPESGDYELIHLLSVANTTYYENGADYTVDDSKFARSSPFDRIAYCMELVRGGVTNWAWASMDAYTTDLTKIGVPTADRGAAWQLYVDNMNVYASPNAAVTTGVGITTGNIEFWPSNYEPGNSKGIPGASDSEFDFGDSGFSTTAGHGSMQIHNYGEAQTIMSMTSFGSNGRHPSLGIGNNTDFSNNATPYPDWTFSYNVTDYSVKNIYVLVRNGTPAAPTGTPPRIWTQPASLTIDDGQNALFNVYSPDAATYQWRKNGEWISGANSSILELSDCTIEDSETYDVLVMAADGSYTASDIATLSVVPQGTLIILR